MAVTFDFTLEGAAANSLVPLDTYTITVGGSSVSIQGANDYFNAHPKYAKWECLSDDDKKRFLVQGSARIDREPFGGRQSTDEQRLQWPRAFIIDRNFEKTQDFLDYADGYYFQRSEYLPLEISYAVFEQALHYIEEWSEEQDIATRRQQERASKYTVGPLSVEMRRAREDRLPSVVIDLLRAAGPNAWQGGSMTRTVR